MPKSDYFTKKIDGLLERYIKVFPKSMFPGTFKMVTHITPDEERMKKMYCVFPGNYEPTYSGLPALVVTVHQHHGCKTSLRVRVTNLISGSSNVLSVKVSRTSLRVNHVAMDIIINMLKKHMWMVGPATPDHYAE